MPRIHLAVTLFALAACSPEPDSKANPEVKSETTAKGPAYQRFQARYDGPSPRTWTGLAGFCHQESERFLMLVAEDAGMVYFILPEHREWRTGDYAVNDLSYADPDLSDPDLIYAELMGIDPREQKEDGVLYDTDVTSGTVQVGRAMATHLTGTLRLNVRVRVNDPAGPSRTERATITAAFDAYPVARCPGAMTGG